MDGPRTGAIDRAGTAIPALLRMQDNRGFPFLGMRYVHIYRAYLYTNIAPGAAIRIEQYRLVRCRDIGNSKNFILSHVFLQ